MMMRLLRRAAMLRRRVRIRMDLDDLDDFRALAGRVIARRDQALADVRDSAQVVNAYLEGLENMNVQDPLRSQLVRDFALEYWRQSWGLLVDGKGDADHAAPEVD